MTVYVTSSVADAHLIQSELRHHGIRCAVHGDQLTDTLSIYGSAVAKVEVMVDRHEAAAARQIVAGLNLNPGKGGPDRWGYFDHPDWKCAGCEEINGATFDECWACQQPRTQESMPVLEREDAAEPVVEDAEGTASLGDTESPYRAPATQSRVVVRPEPDSELADRAFRAAVLGLVFPIPMSIVAVRLSLKSLTRTGVNRKAILAGLLAIPFSIFALGCLVMALVSLVRAFQ